MGPMAPPLLGAAGMALSSAAGIGIDRLVDPRLAPGSPGSFVTKTALNGGASALIAGGLGQIAIRLGLVAAGTELLPVMLVYGGGSIASSLGGAAIDFLTDPTGSPPPNRFSQDNPPPELADPTQFLFPAYPQDPPATGPGNPPGWITLPNGLHIPDEARHRLRPGGEPPGEVTIPRRPRDGGQPGNPPSIGTLFGGCIGCEAIPPDLLADPPPPLPPVAGLPPTAVGTQPLGGTPPNSGATGVPPTGQQPPPNPTGPTSTNCRPPQNQLYYCPGATLPVCVTYGRTYSQEEYRSICAAAGHQAPSAPTRPVTGASALVLPVQPVHPVQPRVNIVDPLPPPTLLPPPMISHSGPQVAVPPPAPMTHRSDPLPPPVLLPPPMVSHSGPQVAALPPPTLPPVAVAPPPMPTHQPTTLPAPTLPPVAIGQTPHQPQPLHQRQPLPPPQLTHVGPPHDAASSGRRLIDPHVNKVEPPVRHANLPPTVTQHNGGRAHNPRQVQVAQLRQSLRSVAQRRPGPHATRLQGAARQPDTGTPAGSLAGSRPARDAAAQLGPASLIRQPWGLLAWIFRAGLHS
jgi:hypothetical protein